jgi:hypothetical protein
MNTEDLLYTNRFVNTNSLTTQQLNQNANDFIPYRTIKNQTVDNVRDNLERTFQKDNPLTQQHLRSYGWNKGNFGNEKPVLSDFARDIGESSYYRYKTSYINIDSRMRDVNLYPYPNNYNMFLGRKFQNIECIKLVDYYFPESNYPINNRNNQIVFFTIPYDMITKVDSTGTPINSVNLTTIISNESILSFFASFQNLGNTMTDCAEAQEKVRNNIYKNLFSFRVSEGNYTTTDLEKEIESKWNTLQYFNSHLITADPYIYADGDTTTKSLYNRPQLVDVSINPDTSKVSFLLRYEKLKVEYVKSYYGKNYFDLLIKTNDPLVSSQEYLELANNEIYPIHITGLPSLGGVKEYNINVGYVPFTQICLYNSYYNVGDCEANIDTLVYYNYYAPVKDPDTGDLIPNLLRFYLYNQYYTERTFNIFEPLVLSSSDKIEYNDSCKLLCDARIGREAPFFLLASNVNPLNQVLLQYNNNIYNLLPQVCNNYNCDILYPGCPDPTNPNYAECCRCQIDKTEPFCRIVDSKFEVILNNLLNNIDCSSRLLINILGFFNTLNNQTTIGIILYARGFQTNNDYKLNSYIKSISTINILVEEATKFIDCERAQNPPNENANIQLIYTGGDNLKFKLPICKNSNGTYSFYFENYMFLKILNNGTMINTAGTEIQQIKPTSQYANGSEDIYLYTGDSINGFSIETCINSGPNVAICIPPVPGSLCDVQTSGTASTFQKLSKNIENIFAKIKLSTIAGSCSVENVMENEVIFYDGSLINMDELVIQLIDYEGKIIELSRDHNFTIMIVEKIEILKETNINTRTGFINTMGSIPVNRNNNN